MDCDARLRYAEANRDRYLDWIGNVANGPYEPLDFVEFAIITAHTPMEAAIRGFSATRQADGVSAIARGLDSNGVLAPYVKAARIAEARDRLGEDIPYPSYTYKAWRRDWKVRGLGYCKASFACSLIDPFNADVLCLDTHMVQAVAGSVGETNIRRECARLYRNPKEYEATEDILLSEAEEVGLPPFAYQWATWDYQRCIRHGQRPESHSFLWDWGNARFQLSLF